jgi:tRNA-dihydrouridine synthase 3
MTRPAFLGDGLIMAPMSRGTDLPFRRLAREWGAEVCLGEMAYAHKVVRGAKTETALLRRHPDERCFGAQLAGKDPAKMAEAASIAEEAGADFVDINMGCPIDDATRRGYGAAMLRKAGRVTTVVRAMKDAVSIPVTVKLRLGWASEKPTYLKIARAAEEGGVDAITRHARSRNQRYRRPAEWSHVAELVGAVSVPVIGNGDILTWQDAGRRLEETGCAAVMVGRWALAKPWIFREFTEQRDILPDVDERVAMLRRYVELCLEHFGDDEMGRNRVRRFMVFHQDFFRRYRPGAGLGAVNSDDPRDWGESPSTPLEEWLCRSDQEAVEALCRWLVDNGQPTPPPPPSGDTRRAVKVSAWG